MLDCSLRLDIIEGRGILNTTAKKRSLWNGRKILAALYAPKSYQGSSSIKSRKLFKRKLQGLLWSAPTHCTKIRTTPSCLNSPPLSLPPFDSHQPWYSPLNVWMLQAHFHLKNLHIFSLFPLPRMLFPNIYKVNLTSSCIFACTSSPPGPIPTTTTCPPH